MNVMNAASTAEGERKNMTNIEAEEGAPETGRQTAKATKKARVAKQKPDVASKKGKAGTKATPAKKATPAATPKKVAKADKAATKPERTSVGPRAESKGAKILELIGRTNGATLTEIMKATGWQAHSVRGFLSTASKKRGIKIESTKNDDGMRNYSVKN
jgi:Protein of unknown function (DUF3489)